MTNKPDVIKAALSVGKQESVYTKEIWNEAIEAAANLNNALTTHQKNNIRKLKK